MDYQQLVELAIRASIEAGEAILKVYDTSFEVEKKDDNSPLTLADKNAHHIIVSYLKSTELPILSEEGKHMKYEERKNWDHFWMVDPLDGTKEFIKRNGEFTVNIALIHKEYPVMGVIYVPVKQTLYFGITDSGAYKCENVSAKDLHDLEAMMKNGKKMPVNSSTTPYTIVGSKSHPSVETQEFIEEVSKEKGEVNIVSMGSSLKLCLVAEGIADAYPRFAPTMEWDTAAGQAIVEASNARVINWETKNRMSYNKENLLNSWFLASRIAYAS